MPERAEKNSNFKLPPELLDLLTGTNELELEDVDMEVDELEFVYQPGVMPALQRMVAATKGKPTSLLEAPFTFPIHKYPGQIVEVTLGATKSEGGSRGKSIVIGGEKSPAFYTFENPTLNLPVISLDVFDSKVPIPKAVKTNFNDALED
ncbi:CO dehydrogenase/acetyl-CoA synthase subunit delta, partial [Candidatus Bathyarchaeota archaeon]|nr:CO dehydrogenase/acetyl-CoA synthase subunit delta [Candidatus Bathyarchaeota archaeon]